MPKTVNVKCDGCELDLTTTDKRDWPAWVNRLPRETVARMTKLGERAAGVFAMTEPPVLDVPATTILRYDAVLEAARAVRVVGQEALAHLHAMVEACDADPLLGPLPMEEHEP